MTRDQIVRREVAGKLGLEALRMRVLGEGIEALCKDRNYREWALTVQPYLAQVDALLERATCLALGIKEVPIERGEGT